MVSKHHTHEPPLVDEGSWAYLIGPADREDAAPLRDRLVEACEASGWPVVNWSTAEVGQDREPGNFFEGVRHAVEHADVVVAMLGANSGSADAELAMAYGHRRPIVGIRLPDEGSSISETQAMLGRYERARVIACDDVDGCAIELRAVLSDPDFAATIHAAAREFAGDA